MALDEPISSASERSPYPITDTFEENGDRHTVSVALDELDAELQLICGSAPKCPLKLLLLRYLIWLKIRPKDRAWSASIYQAGPLATFHEWALKYRLPTPAENTDDRLPPEVRGKRPSGWDTEASAKAIFWEFYWWAFRNHFTDNKYENVKDAYEAGRTLVHDLRLHLNSYYGDPRHKADEIRITLPLASKSYQPRIDRLSRRRAKGQTSVTDDTLITNLAAHNASVLQWRSDCFHEILTAMKAKPYLRLETEEEDVRIWTTAFDTVGVSFDDLAELISNGYRVRVLLMDPYSTDLVKTRNRHLKHPGSGGEITGQINLLSNPEKFPRPSKEHPDRGWLELKVSDLLPFGFTLHSSEQALMGLLWAHQPFAEGQMLKIASDSLLWKSLKEDWKIRWDNGWEPGRRPLEKKSASAPSVTVAEFEDFFGDRLAMESDVSEIVLLPDTVDTMFSPTPEVGAKDRAWKARNWINRWDYTGAEALRQAFLTHKISPPNVAIRRYENIEDKRHIRLRISMGLAFTTGTNAYFERICDPWMLSRVDEEKWGNAIYFHSDIDDFAGQDRCDAVAIDKMNYFRWLPSDYKNYPSAAGYMAQWSRNQDPENIRDERNVSDYAIILRHTETDSKGRIVHLVLAGFTERSTAIAGRYVAHFWPALWTEYVKDRVQGVTRGDFLAVIEGPSNPAVFDRWKVSFDVTPGRLTKFPEALWRKR